jgi:hypothetical protein
LRTAFAALARSAERLTTAAGKRFPCATAEGLGAGLAAERLAALVAAATGAAVETSAQRTIAAGAEIAALQPAFTTAARTTERLSAGERFLAAEGLVTTAAERVPFPWWTIASLREWPRGVTIFALAGAFISAFTTAAEIFLTADSTTAETLLSAEAAAGFAKRRAATALTAERFSPAAETAAVAAEGTRALWRTFSH